MKKRKKSKAKILTATALKIAPLAAVVILGSNFVVKTINEDYGGIFDLNRLNREVVSVQTNPYVGNGLVYNPQDNTVTATPQPIGMPWEYEDVVPEISTELLESGFPFATIDWNTLKGYNQDIVSYIIVDGTHISYPVVQSSDNQDYMDTNFRGESERCGTPFVDYRTEFSDNEYELRDVTVVYGHHMNGGLMFADLTKYENQSFYESHPFFLMYTPDGQAYKIDVVAVNIISGEDDTTLHAWDFASELDFNKYYSRVRYNSLIQTSTPLEYGDKIMTLVTCTYSHGSNKRCQVIGKVTKVLVNQELLEQSNIDYNIVK